MPRNSPVSAVMTADVLTFGPGDNVADAMTTLVDRDITGAPVVESDGSVVGVVSTGDLIVAESRLHFPTVISLFGATLELPSSKRRFEEDLRRTLGSTVSDVMTRDPITIDANDTVEAAATLMHRHDIARLPVIDAGGLVGIVSRIDILREILSDEAAGSTEPVVTED